MTYQLKIIEEGAKNRFALISDTGNIYKITGVLYDILTLYADNKDCENIALSMNAKYNTKEFTRIFVENAVAEVFKKISFDGNTNVQFQKYIKGRIVLIKEGSLSGVYKSLRFLFHPKIFTPLFIFSILLTFTFLYSNHLLSLNAIYNLSAGFLPFRSICIIYLLFIGIILCHEIGHATASFYYAVKPKEIGFGFYFVFPVFYTNVSDIWLLKMKERNVVNIAGIYFQMLINAILIIVHYTTGFNMMIAQLIIANIASILLSLIPFFRYDGYWIFSDYFHLPNLQQKAREFILNIIFSRRRNQTNGAGDRKWPLIIYSIANLCFWVYVYVYFTNYIINNGQTHIKLFFAPHQLFLWEPFLKNTVEVVVIVVTAFLFLNQIWNALKQLYYESGRIYSFKN